MQRFRVDLKTFLGLASLTNAAMLSESKYLADFLVRFLGKKPQTLLIPIYSTTILYDALEIVHQHDYLGVKLHSFMTWSYHIQLKINKATKVLSARCTSVLKKSKKQLI